ncbi:MAG: hypothetical protein H3Z50_02970 [archaeon]|nr:hypothetical protein [archaeon]MCP8306814.1 hypothetical protein [archaeon]
MVDRHSLSRPPLNLLVNPEAIKKQKPWELDIANLLEIFSSMIEGSELLDLRLCGSAVISSALIYRLKVETLFLFEKLKVKRGRKPIKSLEPPTFEMPFRHELYSTSLDELISILERIIKKVVSEPKKEEPKRLIEPEPLPEVDPFSLQIEALLSSFRADLLSELKKKEEILFSEYVRGMQLLDAVRSFILLLFIATEGIITLEQVGEDIKVKREVQYITR